MLYSLPTICDAVPACMAIGDESGRFVLHEDDWRQVEMVARHHIEVVDAELIMVQAVYENHGYADDDGAVFAFDAIYIRRLPVAPIPVTFALGDLLATFPAPARTYTGVGFAGSPGVVADSFAFGCGPDVVYGVAPDGQITVLGLHRGGDLGPDWPLRGPLVALMHAHDLIMVDWPRCQVEGHELR